MKVTEENFNEMINTGKPVMVDFGATWCGPCKALAPRIEEIEKEYEGKAVIGTADVDECSDLAAKFRIRNVPTVLFFKGSDQPVDKSVGLVAKEILTKGSVTQILFDSWLDNLASLAKSLKGSDGKQIPVIIVYFFAY